ncbi:MAG: FAD:protein FMN transferase [Verrucomicrobiota bacterium]|nr:FAD:protein FMN transferase [Verrucomicrobiota bacterium]MDP7048363.1 FAD:protein FMN transferase [Verrucomicrobiota bacterium]
MLEKRIRRVMKPQGDRVVDTGARSIADAHHFSHEAMATVFELFIVEEDESYARGGAQAAFAEVDRLEMEMSRFIENSDIARLNSAFSSEIVEVGMEVFDCLSRAVEMCEQTGGAFDISIGALYECWLNEDKTVRQPSEEEVARACQLTGMNHLKLDTESFGVEVLSEGLQLDLGGIGKGFAAEKVAEILREWSLGQALVLAGASSVLSVSVPDGMSGWPIRLRNPSCPSEILARFELTKGALSGSGRQKGQHIIDPREAGIGPVEGRLAAWSMADDAVTADALSTAFMVLEPAEIDDYCLANPQTAAIIIPDDASGKSQRTQAMCFGQWRGINWESD